MNASIALLGTRMRGAAGSAINTHRPLTHPSGTSRVGGLAVNATPEEWRPVVGWEGLYEVSDQGRVRSLDRIVHRDSVGGLPIRGRVLRQAQCRSRKYGLIRLTVNLSVNQRKRTSPVHRLVLEAFVGPRPPGQHGCHHDGDPTNNHLSNLRWDTPKSNTADMVRHGRGHWMGQTHCKRGHDLANAYIKADGARQCRECHNLTHRRRRAARRPAPPGGLL